MSEKRSLLDIHADVIGVQREIDMSDGEMSDQHEIILHELQLEENQKLMSVAAWVKSLDMEIEGLTQFRDEVAERLRKTKALKDRLKQFIWKAAKMCGIVDGDNQKGYTGTKLSSSQLTLSWRRSQATELIEESPEGADLHKSYPHFFDYEVRVKEEGGHMLMALVEEGTVEILKKSFRKKEAGDYLKTKKIGVAGVKTVHRINPIIKG